MIVNQIDRLKLLFLKDKELRVAIHDILGFYPHEIDVYKIAFTHSSSENKGQKGKLLNNERLEFLGDAVLETVVSDIVFEHFPRKREGFLTGTRSKIVQRSTLNQLAEKMGIIQLVKTNMNVNSPHNNIGGNAFEALMGAIYLDRGYGFCYRFIEQQVLGKYINLDNVAKKEENFKSKLLEWSQKNRLKTDIRIVRSEPTGKNSDLFRSVVFIEGVRIGEGKGYSKKESHQDAAKRSLMKMRKSKKLINSIFQAKEKRTSMEAEEFATLPAENDASVVMEQSPKKE